MRKKIILVTLSVLICLMSVATFGACAKNTEEEPSREVVLELVNPNTGEAVEEDEIIDLPKEKTPIEVRIKDKETGKYLTDDYLPENTIKGSYHTNLIRLVKDSTKDGVYIRDHLSSSNNYWPIEEDNTIYMSYYYEIVIFFDCRPEKPSNPREFQRRYRSQTKSIRFYSSRYLDYVDR